MARDVEELMRGLWRDCMLATCGPGQRTGLLLTRVRTPVDAAVVADSFRPPFDGLVSLLERTDVRPRRETEHG